MLGMAITAAAYWPGMLAFLVLLGLSLTGLRYYARSKPRRSALFWVAGISVCVMAAYLITTFTIVPLLLRILH